MLNPLIDVNNAVKPVLLIPLIFFPLENQQNIVRAGRSEDTGTTFLLAKFKFKV